MKMGKVVNWKLAILILSISNVTIFVLSDDFTNLKYESASPSSSTLTESEDDSFYENDLKSKELKSRGSRTYESLDYGKNDDGSYDGKWVDTIPGDAGKDYPSYERIPKTSFTCQGRKTSGYYADIETDCQVFHICAVGGQKISFLCPNGSIFNQRVLVCDWWYDVDCQSSNDVVEDVSRYQNDQLDQLVIVEGYGIENGYDLNLASSGGNDPPQKPDSNNNDDTAKNINGDMVKEEHDRAINRFSKNKKISNK